MVKPRAPNPNTTLGQKLTRVHNAWSAAGHMFNEHMTCACGIRYEQHQLTPISCPVRRKKWKKAKQR